LNKKIKIKNITSLVEIISFISNLKVDKNTQLAFRGEIKDYQNRALTPSLYRKKHHIRNEELIYREMQRFNDNEFSNDRTAFDKLSRMQHYSAPTRLLDISEDILSAIYFAIGEKENLKEDSYIYVLELNKKKIKYYDSDSVSVVSNISKIPLKKQKSLKSKESLLSDISKYGDFKNKFNKQESSKFLIHEIREEKPHFEPIINPKDLTSIQCVRPKLTSHRIKSQKGFFLLFGLNPDDSKKPIPLIKNNMLLNNCNIQHPINKIHILKLKSSNIEEMKKDLEKLGIIKPFIYPEIDKVAEYLKGKI